MPQQLDPARGKQFAGKMLSTYNGAMLSLMIMIGYRTGLLEAAATGPATSAELADRAGLHERYVREWLGAVTTGGIFDYDPATQQYTLPPEHAVFLAGESWRNAAPQSQMLFLLGRNAPQVIECFKTGGGVPYSAFMPEFTTFMDDLWRRIYDDQLIEGFLAVAPAIPARLRSGSRAADVGCGTGHALNLMAREYPASSFVGYDLNEASIEQARAEAVAMELTNVRFEVQDIAHLTAEPKLDLITAFDAIHDQKRPQDVLGAISDALEPDGIFFLMDIKAASDVESNKSNRFAPFIYGISLLHCMTVSLAEGGAGLGTAWGEQLARRLLAEAGFNHVDFYDSPRPQNCIYVCRK